MKLLNITASNFGSYKDITFNFIDTGLALVYGPTGSGKSTMQDAVCWVLFGITAKDGSVDDVRTWNNLDHPTIGTLTIELGQETVSITRIRGKSGQNDLYWDKSGQTYRGKDISETQKLFEKFIGINSMLYLSGAYFSEFSPISNFFTAKTNDRRKILEEIANLDFPVLMSEKIRKELQGLGSKINHLDIMMAKTEGKLEQAHSNLVSMLTAENKRSTDRDVRMQQNKKKREDFENKRFTALNKLIEEHKNLARYLSLLDEKEELCTECGSIKNKEQRELNKTKRVKLQNIRFEIKELKRRVNPYLEEFTEEAIDYNKEISLIKKNVISLGDIFLNFGREKEALTSKRDELDELTKINSQLKAVLLHNSVESIQNNTNEHLDKYFDSMLKIELSVEKADSIKLNIWKDGYVCSYKQLSKGQRGVLRLCFSISVMKAVANRSGASFENLFFDEALDGLDTDLKVKAFSLFQELSLTHSSILLIDHCEEFKLLFDKKYEVHLESGNSVIKEIK